MSAIGALTPSYSLPDSNEWFSRDGEGLGPPPLQSRSIGRQTKVDNSKEMVK